ncbi:M23 family metallopeptidase [Siculibacillus lacustris]|uniref:M23 family metallopeptidase n=1 Tax=Siculibacillus lacustris TaxID=1549641 RepID=A0A4Q9VW07_9HYPH|nr:M23 family metallopeptidase [Siculibacillus lacustris]TBW40459.1 M23 family metallopeptidase [Siculibacillus lacustris]
MRHRLHDDRPEGIDLGSELPLRVDGGVGALDRRAVSLRWMAGTVLTAFTSTFLMGGALYVALDGRHTLAATPAEISGVTDRIAARALDRPIAVGAGILAKADRLKIAAERAATRQVLNLSTMTRVGDKDMVRVRPFVRVAAGLSLRAPEARADIPAFNPLKVFADTDLLSGRSSTSKNPAFYDADVEGEISLRTRDLPTDLAGFDADTVMSSAEVERIVGDQARFLSDGSIQVAALPVSDGSSFGTIPGFPGLTSALAMRIVPENVSFFAKSDAAHTGAQAGNGLDEKVVTVEKTDTLRGLLKDANADEKTIVEIIRGLTKGAEARPLEVGQRVRIGLAKIDQTEKLKPVRVSIYGKDGGHLATVALDDNGGFVAAEEPGIGDAMVAPEDEDETLAAASGVPSIYYSLYQTALDNQIPTKLIKQLVDIYSYDVDFNQRVRQGDQFEVLYAADDQNDAKATQEILYASISIAGQPKRYYRYRSPDDGTIDYYDEAGKSAKKFLMRKPMDGGVFRSGFGGRRHPIYGYYRMHTGVDWAAPMGTPIFASGNGVVTEEGWKGGYGRYIRLQHNNGYETGYGHMSGFARGVEKGTRVRQGQVIGYVGSTGASTGPHCHYEVLINQAFVDPMRVKLPRGRELGGPMLAEFGKERERIDGLMSKQQGTARLAGFN